MTLTILILPGLGGSGDGHWQRHFAQTLPAAHVVEQAEWDAPRLDAWLATLTNAIADAPRRPVLVAHSLACSLVAHLAATPLAGRIAGALLVAPADVESEDHTPAIVRDFAPIPRQRLPFPATVIASRNDPYMTLARARSLARDWRALFVDAGDAGHINVASGFGPWPAGIDHLRALIPDTAPLPAHRRFGIPAARSSRVESA